MTPDAVEFHKALILLALDAARAWETYLESTTGAHRALHGSLLRLAKGIVKGLGAAQPEEVSSPTFTLIHQYGPNVYHIDLYRLDREREVETLGLDEIFEKNAVALIEWGERFRRLMPPGSLEIRLELKPDEAREVTCNF